MLRRQDLLHLCLRELSRHTPHLICSSATTHYRSCQMLQTVPTFTRFTGLNTLQPGEPKVFSETIKLACPFSLETEPAELLNYLCAIIQY